MFKLRHFLLSLSFLLLSSQIVHAQKYVQISTEKQQESTDVIIYEFFGMAVLIVLI